MAGQWGNATLVEAGVALPSFRGKLLMPRVPGAGLSLHVLVDMLLHKPHRGAAMNEVIRAILARRSVRAFRAESIKTEDLDAILECAWSAPSAMNVQNWHFTAIRDGAFIDKLNGWIAAEITENGNPYLQGILERSDGKVFRNAPCVIIVSTEKQDRFSIINASAATRTCSLLPTPSGLDPAGSEP